MDAAECDDADEVDYASSDAIEDDVTNGLPEDSTRLSRHVAVWMVARVAVVEPPHQSHVHCQTVQH